MVKCTAARFYSYGGLRPCFSTRRAWIRYHSIWVLTRPSEFFLASFIGSEGKQRAVRLVKRSQLLTYAFLGCLIIFVSTVTHTSVRPCQVLAHSKSTDIVICHTFIFICVRNNQCKDYSDRPITQTRGDTSKLREIQAKAKGDKITAHDPFVRTLVFVWSLTWRIQM